MVAPTKTIKPASKLPVFAIRAPITTGENAPITLPKPVKNTDPGRQRARRQQLRLQVNKGGSAAPQKKALAAMVSAAVLASGMIDTAYISAPAMKRPTKQTTAPLAHHMQQPGWHSQQPPPDLRIGRTTLPEGPAYEDRPSRRQDHPNAIKTRIEEHRQDLIGRVGLTVAFSGLFDGWSDASPQRATSSETPNFDFSGLCGQKRRRLRSFGLSRTKLTVLKNKNASQAINPSRKGPMPCRKLAQS
jgi:hypothetical protein